MIDVIIHNTDTPLSVSARINEMKSNFEMLKAFRTWLFLSPIEREIFEDDYPELAWLGDDLLIGDMQNEIWSSLN